MQLDIDNKGVQHLQILTAINLEITKIIEIKHEINHITKNNNAVLLLFIHKLSSK